MSVQVIDTLKPKNNGTFPIVDAEDVSCGTVRLPEALNGKADKSALDATNAAVAGKANTSDVNTVTASLQAQINQLITPVTQDAEVENARVGANNTVYSTLKERIDTEVTGLNKDIDNYARLHTVVTNHNIYDKSADIISGIWIGSDGTYNENANSKIARIPVCGGNVISLCYCGATERDDAAHLGGYAVLDKNLSVLSVIQAEEHISTKRYNTYKTFSFEVPANCRFVDITVKLATTWDATNDFIAIYNDEFDVYDGTGDTISSLDGMSFVNREKSERIAADSEEEAERKSADNKIYDRLKDGGASNTEITGTNPIYTECYDETTDIIDGYWINDAGEIKSVSSCKYAQVPIEDIYNYGYALVSLGLNKTKSYISTSIGGILLLDDSLEQIGSVILPEDCDRADDYNNDYCLKVPITSEAKYLCITAKLATTWDATSTISVRVVSDYTNKVIRKIFGCNIQTSPEWAGKKWIAFGDSLTEVNSRTTMHYHDYIAESTGITVLNYGASGTGYKRSENDGKAFYQRIENIPTDVDVITIFGSGNDLNYVAMELPDFATALGTVTDDTTDTICGCINITLDKIWQICPTVEIGIVTPTPWQHYSPANNNNPMDLYSNAIIEICKNRGISCLDLYHCSNLRPWDATFRTIAYSKDDGNGTHPDETGHKIIAPRFKAFLDTLIL